MTKKFINDWNQLYHYNNAVCDAILLQFTKFLYQRFKIPSVSCVRELISEAISQLNERPLNLNFCSTSETNFKSISKPLFDKIAELTFEGDNDCWLRDYLWRSDKFFIGFCYGEGDLFEYIDLKEAKSNISKRLSKKEIKEINRLGKLMRKNLLQKSKRHGLEL